MAKPSQKQTKQFNFGRFAWSAVGVCALIGIGYILAIHQPLQPTPTPVAATPKPMESSKPQLEIKDLVVGTGEVAKTGDLVTVNYVGTFTDGKKFDSSYDRNQPFSFKLGARQVIKGWDQGLVGMKVGGKRKLTIPGDLAYGPQGFAGFIPPNATLIFEVELLSIQH